MPAHSEQQQSPYSVQQLFDLVADVERYPDFLPWCRAARILWRGEDVFEAELIISFKHMSERYTSRVELTPADAKGHAAITATMVKGPFHHLVNRWAFQPSGKGSMIDFFLDFKFRSKLMEMMVGPMFGSATLKMVGAFRERADALYGPKPKK